MLVVDLSKPERLWSTVTSLVSSITEYIASALKTEQARNLKVEERLEKDASARVGEDHPDVQHIKPFPVPLLILGGMYDVFQDLEPEKKKVICRTLRYLAHTNGASVQFYSSRDPGLVKKARDLLSHHGFNTPAGKGVSQDYNKPLIIPAGSDSFQAILGGNGGEVPKLEVMRHQFGTHFPQEEEETLTRSDDPAKDPNFREAEVDILITILCITDALVVITVQRISPITHPSVRPIFCLEAPQPIAIVFQTIYVGIHTTI